jgi:hypothetical protein
MNMWGYPHCDMTFQEACARNDPQDMTVSAPERRAVALLATLCDPERVGRYLATGMLYARGNVTGTVFCLVRVSPKVVELDHRGVPVATWCIHAHKRGWNPNSYSGGTTVPITDEVITLKNLIEGEEAVFRLTGNRTAYRPVLTARQIPGAFAGRFPGDGLMANPYIDFEQNDYVKKAQTPDYKARGVCDPHRIDFMGGMMPQMDPAIVALAQKKFAERVEFLAHKIVAEALSRFVDVRLICPGRVPRLYADDLIHPDDDPNLFEALPDMIQEPIMQGQFRGLGTVGLRAFNQLDAAATIACDPKINYKKYEDGIRADEQWEITLEKSKKRVEVSIL